MTVYSQNITEQVRDLSDVLSTLIAIEPTFISLFKPVDAPINTRHEWNNDLLKPREIAYTGYNTSTGTFTVAGSSGWSVGDMVRIKGDPAVFRVKTLDTTSIAVEFTASNGSDITSVSGVPATPGVLIYDSHPMVENSATGPKTFSQSGVDYNHTQIFRLQVEMSRTAQAIRKYGNENRMNLQMGRAMRIIRNDINRAALFGVRKDAPTSDEERRAGGLYYYGAMGGAVVDANSGALSIKAVNDAAQTILSAGGKPNLILCGNGQARVISQLMRNQISIVQQETTRGTFVNRVMLESRGTLLQVFVDDAMDANDTDIWVMDSSGFGLSWLTTLESRSIGPAAVDGNAEMIIGEVTFEMVNFKERLCRIKKLKDSASTLV